MRTKDRLTFYLVIQENCSEVVNRYRVHPSYDKLQLSYTKDGDKVYYTQKVDCEFALHGQECMLVQRQSLLAKFTMEIYDRGEIVASGIFRKTDCATDMNHQVVTFSINANDMYEELESNNSEYNMVKWGLEKHSLDINIKPTLLVYGVGDEKIHRFGFSGYHYESEPTEEVNDGGVMQDTYHFKGRMVCHMLITCSNSALDSFLSSSNFMSGYTYNSGSIVYPESDYVQNEKYKVTFTYQSGGFVVTLLDKETQTTYNGEIFNQGTNIDNSSWGSRGSIEDIFNNELSYYSIRFQTANATLFARPVMKEFDARIDGGYSSSLDYNIPSEDIINSSSAIGKCKPAGVTIVTSTNTSAEDNGYISASGNLWYAPPDSSGNWIPILKGAWKYHTSVTNTRTYYSYWVSKNVVSDSLVNQYESYETIRDWYTLGDLIKGLIGQIDPSLTFESDTEHSQFLFANINPVSGAQQYTYYVTQKSNLLNYRYEYPAWSALITWNRLETMLRCLFNCYYDIYVDAEGVKHLRIEHINFYNNGCSYSNDPRRIVDLTNISDTNNRKPMAFLTDRWKYDTNRPYSRWEFSWMDTQSEPFDAFPMQVPKRYMIYSRNTIDTRTIDWFSADIDFLLSAQQEASSDGFMIVMDDGDGNIHQGNVTIGGTTYYCQNDRLALGYLQKEYLLTNIYSPYVNIDNTEELTETMEGTQKRMRLQEVEFGMPSMSYPRAEYLYKTELGVGSVDQIIVDLTDMHCTATIRHDNETIE